MTKSFKFLSRVLLIGLLAVLVLNINVDFIMAGTNTFIIQNTDDDHSYLTHYYMYFPTNSSPGTYQCEYYSNYINTPGNLTVRPYTIHVTYTYHLDNNNYNDQDVPYLSVMRCDSSGNLIYGSETTLQISKGSTTTQNIDINPNEGLRFDYFNGRCYRRNSHHERNHKAYTGYVQISYQFDETAPNTPVLNLVNANDTSHVKNINGIYYSSLKPTVIQWNNPGDPGTPSSGVRKYNIYNNQSLVTSISPDNANPNNNRYNLTNEGTYKIQVNASDYENNTSALSSPVTVVTDYTANQPVLPANPITAVPKEQPDGSIIYDVAFKWNTVTDVSGINHYEVALSQNSSQPYDNEISSVTATQYSFSNIASSTTDYYTYVRAIDAVGNTSAWTKSGSIALYYPPSSFGKIVPQAAIENGQAVYSVTLPITDTNADKYIIQRQKAGANSKTPIAVLTRTQLADLHFTYVDTSNLEKHGRYIYLIYTQSDVGAISSATISEAVVIPNIAATVTVVDSNGQTVTDGLAIGQNSYTFNTSPQTDSEGDEIRHRVCYKLKDDIKVYYSHDSDALQPGPVTITFPGEGSWQTWLDVGEYDVDAEVNRYQTSIRTIQVDTTAPPVESNSFVIQSRMGGQILDSQNNPTSTRNVSVGNVNLNDNPGGSGIQGIRLWNGEATVPPADAVYKKFNEISTPLDWTLAEGGDGIRTVAMQVIDNAGNTTRISCQVQLDTTAPAAPERDKLSHITTGSQITFQWQAVDPTHDVAGFQGQYTLPDGTNQKFDIIASSEDASAGGSLTVPVTGYGPNLPVHLTVYSVDKAGNLSATVSYTAYTQAALVALQNLDGGYDSGLQQFFLSWQLSTLSAPGAAQYILEYGKPETDGFAVIQTLTPDASGIFTHGGLTPHGLYAYRPVAINSSGDRTEGAVFTRQVPNTPPPAALLESPLEFARGTVEFKYAKQNTDSDGDNITYRVYLKADTRGYTLVEGDSIDGLVHGQNCSWYVVADDGYENGKTYSSTGQFSVDNSAPELTTEPVRRPYTNQTKLNVTVGDDLSGIAKVTYKKTDAATNEIIKEGIIELSSGADGKATGLVQLEEGYYHLSLTAIDKAGNSKPLDLTNLKVDQTPPQLLGATLDLAAADGGYYTGTGKLPVSFSAKDNAAASSGIHNLRYWILTDRNAELDGGQSVALSPVLQQYSQLLTLSGVNGQSYYLALAVEDAAGNRSAVSYLGPVTLDLTPPEAALVLSGLVSYGAGNYLAERAKLGATCMASDPESGAGSTVFALINATTGETLSGWGDWETVRQTALTAGAGYQVAVQVTNKAGLTTEARSEKFSYDDSPPQDVNLSGPATAVASGELLTFTVSAAEAESALSGYRLAIASADGAKITAAVPGNQDGWLVQENNHFRFELPSVPDGSYFAVAEAVNASGLTSSTYITLTVANHQEKLLVSDQGPYTQFGDKLTGWWKYSGTRTVSGYQYRIADVSNNGQAISDWITTHNTEATHTGLALESGRQYRFEVQADFSDGGSLGGISPGVVVDSSIPRINSLVTPEYTTSAKLSFDWSAEDNESGIAKVWAALGSDYYQNDVSGGWVQISGNPSQLTRQADGKPLELENGQRYYLTLRVSNGAGLVSEQAAAAIIIDNTAPPTPLVADQGDYINPTKQPLKANWIWSASDPQSGLASYQWAFIQYGQDLNSAHWSDAGQTTSATVNDATLADGATYYFAVKATNQAGLSSIGYSDGITIDQTAPVIPEVTLLQAVNLGDKREALYITHTNNLELAIGSYDLSGIQEYQYTYDIQSEVAQNEQYGSSTKAQFTVTPTINENEITVFKAVCSDGAVNISQAGYSTGVILDTGAPQITQVNGAVSGNHLLFDWNAIPSESPLAFYEYALVPEAKINETPAAWTQAGLKRSLSLDGKLLADGHYYLLIRGCNAAGTYSRRDKGEWGISPKITLDRNPPVLDQSSFMYPSFAADKIAVSVTATDALSGIGGYQYALGTLANPTVYSNGWVDVAGNSGLLEFGAPAAQVPHNSLVYLMVRAKDKVGLWSTAMASGKILIDHTVPVTPLVTYGAYTRSRSELSGIQFSSVDPESGTTHYRLGIVTGPGQAWLSIQEAPVDQFDGILAYLTLEEAQTYYIAFQTCNGAGEWSATGYSRAITVDTIAPVLEFAKAESTIILNTPPLDIEYTLSEAAAVEFTLNASDGTAQTFTAGGQAGINRFTFNEKIPQTYQLNALPVDPAGNIGASQTQTIRVNAPPQITLAAVNTTPGATVQFSATVADPDGAAGEIPEYLWEPGDGSTPLRGVSPTHQYARTGAYTLTLTVTDSDGGVSAVTTTVTVGNTTRGALYADESWSGVHHIYGDLSVPAGITLTIEPGTEIIVEAGYGIQVKGSLKITGGGVTFRSTGGQVNDWQGIYLEGEATLNGATIRDAERGLTVVSGATAALTHCVFRNNQVGLHVYGTTPLVESCSFLGNTLYGIKEDEGGRPAVKGCAFSGNGMAYYSETDTEITIEELNQFPGNSGNQ
jgi:hypothetical protein